MLIVYVSLGRLVKNADFRLFYLVPETDLIYKLINYEEYNALTLHDRLTKIYFGNLRIRTMCY